jgi:LysM repeat protein
VRYLAPIALVAAILALVLVVSNFDSGGSGGSGARPRTSQQSVPTRRFYVVRAGDTLSSIAARFGVTQESIVALNPAVDAQALQPGVRLKLRQ